MMSGSANCDWSIQEYPWDVATELSSDLDCGTISSYSLKQCLSTKSAEQLIIAQTNRQVSNLLMINSQEILDQNVRYVKLQY